VAPKARTRSRLDRLALGSSRTVMTRRRLYGEHSEADQGPGSAKVFFAQQPQHRRSNCPAIARCMVSRSTRRFTRRSPAVSHPAAAVHCHDSTMCATPPRGGGGYSQQNRGWSHRHCGVVRTWPATDQRSASRQPRLSKPGNVMLNRRTPQPFRGKSSFFMNGSWRRCRPVVQARW
jgi:hypothetical protein